MTPACNPKRPHPYQISDSEFAVERTHFREYYVIERWSQIERHAPYNTEDVEQLHGPYATASSAVAELERRRGSR